MTDEAALLRRIGLAVRLERVARGLSQNELATAAGISRVTLGSIERGDHPASIVAFVRLSRTTGLSLDRIMNGESAAASTLLGESAPQDRAGLAESPQHGQGSQERDNGPDDGEGR